MIDLAIAFQPTMMMNQGHAQCYVLEKRQIEFGFPMGVEGAKLCGTGDRFWAGGI